MLKQFVVAPIAISLLLVSGCASSSEAEKKDEPMTSEAAKAPAEEEKEKEEAPTADAGDKDIVIIAQEAGTFNTLVTAVTAAELVETLKGEGPYTVFAPTDEAFAKLPEGTVEALLEDKERLKAVLTYHVVPGKVMAVDVAGMDSAVTVQGDALVIDTTDGVMVGNAKVVKTDIVASNGVIHVIDTVLIPAE